MQALRNQWDTLEKEKAALLYSLGIKYQPESFSDCILKDLYEKAEVETVIFKYP